MAAERVLNDAVAKLVDVVARLRGEGGCPWDRAQTRATLRPYVIEEAYEVVEALEGKDPAKLREELGDLLFQVALHAQIAAERREFDFASVAAGLAEKLVRRHPHVFGEEKAKDAEEVVGRWEALKRAEREANGEPTSHLAGIPPALPALARAQKLQERAARAGFEWEKVGDIFAKLDEERRELENAIEAGGEPSKRREALEHEVGDILFTVVNVARAIGVGAEDALRGANHRFERRFRHIEEAARRDGRDVRHLTPSEMQRFWDEAKTSES